MGIGQRKLQERDIDLDPPGGEELGNIRKKDGDEVSSVFTYGLAQRLPGEEGDRTKLSHLVGGCERGRTVCVKMIYLYVFEVGARGKRFDQWSRRSRSAVYENVVPAFDNGDRFGGAGGGGFPIGSYMLKLAPTVMARSRLETKAGCALLE